MKNYMKPEVEIVNFMAETIMDDMDGEVVSLPDVLPGGGQPGGGRG